MVTMTPTDTTTNSPFYSIEAFSQSLHQAWEASSQTLDTVTEKVSEFIAENRPLFEINDMDTFLQDCRTASVKHLHDATGHLRHKLDEHFPNDPDAKVWTTLALGAASLAALVLICKGACAIARSLLIKAPSHSELSSEALNMESQEALNLETEDVV